MGFFHLKMKRGWLTDTHQRHKKASFRFRQEYQQAVGDSEPKGTQGNHSDIDSWEVLNWLFRWEMYFNSLTFYRYFSVLKLYAFLGKP